MYRIESVDVRDGVQEIVATSRGAATVRLQMPTRVVEWAVGVCFDLEVDDEHEDDAEDAASSCWRLRGRVMTVGAGHEAMDGSAIVSFGGLLLQAPRCAWRAAAWPPNDHGRVCARLTVAHEKKKAHAEDTRASDAERVHTRAQRLRRR